MTDDYDRRLLTTMMKYWFADQIFDAHFHFHPGYNMLNFNTLPEYFQAIESMPLKDPPDVCGLHTNADITCVFAVSVLSCSSRVLRNRQKHFLFVRAPSLTVRRPRVAVVYIIFDRSVNVFVRCRSDKLPYPIVKMAQHLRRYTFYSAGVY